MSLFQQRAKHLFWVFFEKFGLVGLSVISFLVYAKFLTPTELGIGVLLLTVVEFVAKFFISLVDSSMIRLKNISSTHDGTAFWLLLIVSCCSSLLTFIAYYLYFEKSEIILASAIVVLLIPFQTISRVHIVHLRRKKQFKLLANRTLIGKLAGMTIGIWLATNDYGEFAIISQAVMMSFTTTVLLLLYERRKLPFIIDLFWVRRQLAVGIPASLKVVNTSLYNKGTILIIEIILGTAAVGFYNFALRLIELPRSAIVNALMGYANPVFSQRLHSGEDIETFFLQSTKISLIFIMPMFIGVSLIANDLIILLFGNKWVESIDLLIGISILTALNMFFLFLPSVLVAHGLTQYALKGQIFSSIAALVVLYLSLPIFDLQAVLLALSTRVILISIANTLACLRVIESGFFSLIKAAYLSFSACLIMWGATSVFSYLVEFDSQLLALLSTIVVAIMVYSISILLIDRNCLREIKRFMTK